MNRALSENVAPVLKMSGGNFSVVTQIKRVIGKLPNGGQRIEKEEEDSVISEEAEGLVTLPGSETDIQIKDIPVLRQEGEGVMPCGYIAAACSSPDTGCSPSAVTRDQMRGGDKTRVTAAIMEENVHLREMLVSQLDLIQQQSETILSKDKQLRQLREENSLLVQRLTRMERRCRGDENEKSSAPIIQGGVGKKRGRDSSVSSQSAVKKKKVEEEASCLIETGAVRAVVDSPQYSQPQDELMDEIMGDIVSVSRPDTPASVASAPDTGAVKKVKKNSEASKRKSLGGGKCNSDGLNDKEVKVKKFKSQPSVSSGEILDLYYSRAGF